MPNCIVPIRTSDLFRRTRSAREEVVMKQDAKAVAWLCVVLMGCLACGSGGQADAATDTAAAVPQPAASAVSSPAADACSLLQKAEVEAAVGRPVKAPVADTAANLQTCSFIDPHDPAGLDNVVLLAVLTASNATAAREVLEIARTNAAGATPVTGIGDIAFWDELLRSLEVVKGAYEVSIHLSSDAGGLPTARKLVQQALSRLP
jgi:hypothetical protein